VVRGEMTPEPSDISAQEEVDFPPAERKVITQSYDLSVSTILDQWDNEQLILPRIQREYVWDNPRASRLVESLLLNIPIPVLYFAEDDDARWEIIDGHQRIVSVVRYLKNEFALSSLDVLGHHNRLRFHQLPDREQRFLKTRQMRAVVISPESHPNMKFEVFERLNTGAIVLNAQELRNSLYRGDFNELLHALVHDSDFRACIGGTNPRKRMVDEEFILRFFALREGLSDYRPPLKRFLNTYMRDRRNPDEETLAEMRELFEWTVLRVRTVFEEKAFRKLDRRGHVTERAPNRALFDAQMLAFSWTDTEEVEEKRADIAKAFRGLYADSAFDDAISLATGDRSRTLFRVRAAVSTLKTAGVEVDAPHIPEK
jgi:hypothetical protein